MEYTTKEEWGVCAECGKYHINPVTKAEVNLDQDITTLLEYTETLMKENTELEAVCNKMDAEISILTRELHDARQELKIAHLEKDILRLEKLALENRLKEVEESLFRESLKKYEKIPNPYPQPSITPCPTPWDPWQRPWYTGDQPWYTTHTNNTSSTINEGDAVFTPPNPEVTKALQKQWDERDRKAAKAKKEELK